MFITDINGKTYELGEVTYGMYGAGGNFLRPITLGSPILSMNDPFWSSSETELKFHVSSGNYVSISKRYRTFFGNREYYMAYYLYNNNEMVECTSSINYSSTIKDFTQYPGANIYIAHVTSTVSTQNDTYCIYSVPSGSPVINEEYDCGTNGQDLWLYYHISQTDFNTFISQAPNPGGDSQPGGGTGDFDDSSDDIDFPENPAFSSVDGAMVSMYSPNLYELNQLASFLWTDSFYESFVKIWGDPMELILSLNLTYAAPTLGESYSLKIGMFDTGVSMKRVVSQFVRIDCGSLSVNEYWGNALDYSPYTKCSIYLPFIGTQTLNTDQIMNSTLSVFYNVDLLSGACVCFLKVTKGNLNSVLYNFSGNVSAQIPLSSSNMSQLQNSLITAIASAGMLASGGINSGAFANVAVGSAMNIISGKREVSYSGRLDSSIGQMSVKFPYLIITRPAQSLPKNYNNFNGYPCNITETLSNLSGFTQIEFIHLENIPASDTELTMIENILKSGVIL